MRVPFFYCSTNFDENSSLSIGVYHDVTSWFKVIAEYSKVEVEWHDGFDQEADVYSVGAFFLWEVVNLYSVSALREH